MGTLQHGGQKEQGPEQQPEEKQQRVEEPPVLGPEDDAILDEVWDTLGREE